MSYDAPTPRRDRDDTLPAGVTFVLAALLCTLACAVTMWLANRADHADATDEKPTITHSSLAPTYTYDGEVIRWYVLVDPDEGVQYLVNDRGGCCVRLDRYGRPMGVLDERGQ